MCDKTTGQCKCKRHVGGLKCDRTVEGGYHLPSIGQYIFSADYIVPHAPHHVLDGNADFDGAVVNGSFASRRVTFNVTESVQTFYIMIYYSLVNGDGEGGSGGRSTKPRIDIEFSKDGQLQFIIHFSMLLKGRTFHNKNKHSIN